MGYRICVYAICKNEEHFVDRWMDSMAEADLIVVTDTGSSDSTAERLRARGAIVLTELVQPWRFDKARNLSLAHVPADVDICVCTDLDEVFRPGWRRQLERHWTPGTTTGTYWYNWSLKPDGTPEVQFQYFKAHTRHDYVWAEPVHEYLRFCGRGQEQKTFIPDMILDHYPDAAKSRGSYLGLLELAVSENPSSDRMNYYLGREYFFHSNFDKCLATLEAYLKLPAAHWREERCAAMRLIARSWSAKKQETFALKWFYRAVAEAPTMREPYVECAQYAYSIKNWPLTLYMCEQALKISEKSNTYVNTGHAWDHTPHDLCAIACYWLGMYDRSLFHARNAVALTPGDERLLDNLRLIAQKQAERVATGIP